MKKLDPIRVRIQNFQSIEDVDLEIRGFTCITGKTNIGKSALLRAISSAVLNDPVVGKVRKGAQFCTVELSSSEWGFKWEKGERVNRYTIGGKVYDKVGQRQLDEIVKMGFGSVKVGDQEIQPWWSSQFAPLFLLDKSGSQVTDFISEVSRLTVLQNAIVLAARGKRQAADGAKAKAEEAAALHDKLSRISDLDKLSKLCKELDEQADSIRSYEKKLAVGETMAARMKALASKIRVLSGVTKVIVPEDTVGPQVAAIATMHAHWTTLESCAKRIIVLRGVSKVPHLQEPAEEYARWKTAMKFSKIDRLKRSVEIMKGVTKVTVPDLSEVDEKIARTMAAFRFHTRLSALRTAVLALSTAIPVPTDPVEIPKIQKALAAMLAADALHKEVRALEAKSKAINKELQNLEKEINSIPSCPTCSRPISSNHIHKAS